MNRSQRCEQVLGLVMGLTTICAVAAGQSQMIGPATPFSETPPRRCPLEGESLLITVSNLTILTDTPLPADGPGRF